MSHPYSIDEIARQAGLSRATVDRVLNNRGGVRASTATAVTRAIADLDGRRRRSRPRLSGSRIDIVSTPHPAWPGVLTYLGSARHAVLVGDADFTLTEVEPDRIVDALDRIRGRGASGIILSAPDRPEIAAAISRLAAHGIPVVTVLSDLPASERIGYVGIDNRAAGATAAYLIDQWMGPAAADVLIVLAEPVQRDHEEKEVGFRSYLRRPPTTAGAVIEICVPNNDPIAVQTATRHILRHHPGIGAAYVVAGDSSAVLAAFADAHTECRALIADGLTETTSRLLHARRIAAVVAHDLEQEITLAAGILQSPSDPTTTVTTSTITVLTPLNLPARSPHRP